MLSLIKDFAWDVFRISVFTGIMASVNSKSAIVRQDEQGKYHDPSCILCDGNPFVDDHTYTPASQVEDEQSATSVATDDNESDEDLVEKTVIVDTVPFTPLKRAAEFKKPDPPKKKCKFIKLKFYSSERCRVLCEATPGNVTRVRTYVRKDSESQRFEHRVYLFQ